MLSFHPTPILAATNAFWFAIQNATTEGRVTICALLVLSLFSWTIIITKIRQLYIARKWARKFFAAYNATRDPLDIKRKAEAYEGAPAYQLYIRGADEVDYHLKNNPGDGRRASRGSATASRTRRSRWCWRRRQRRRRWRWKRG